MKRIIRLCASMLLLGILITGCLPHHDYMMRGVSEEFLRWKPMKKWEYDGKNMYSTLDSLLGGGIGSDLRVEDFLGFPPGDIEAAVKLIRKRDFMLDGRMAVDGMAYNGADAVPELRDLLEDEDSLVVQFACQALRNIGTDSSAVSDEIKKLLKHPDPYVVGAAAEALIYVSEDKSDGISHLVKLMDNQDPDVRKRVAGACWIINEEPGVYPKLLELVKDENPDVRKIPLKSLSYIETGEGLVPVLLSALEDDDASVALGAVRALDKRIDNPQVLDALIDAADHSDATIRSFVLSVIVNSDDERIASVLMGALADTESDVRARAGYELMRIDPEYTPEVDIILDILRSTQTDIRFEFVRVFEKLDPNIRDEIASQLTSMMDELEPVIHERLRPIFANSESPVVVPKLIEGLLSSDAGERAFSALALADMPDAAGDAVGKLEGLLDDPYARVRLNAATALNAIDGREASLVPILSALLGSEDRQIRWDAVRLLKEMGPETEGALDVLVGLFDDDESHYLLQYAIEAVGEIGPNAIDAIGDLAAMLEDDRPAIRSAAAYSICKMGPGAIEVIDALIDALNDPEEEVRARAAGALGIIAPRGEEAIPHLIEALDIEGDRARTSVAEALGRYGPSAKDALPRLMEFLDYVQPVVEGTTMSPKGMGFFFDLYEPDVSMVSALAIYRIDPTAHDFSGYLISKLDEGDFEDRSVAAQYIGLLGDDAYQAIPALTRRLVSTEGNLVREIAISRLGEMGPEAESAVDALLAILDEEENWAQDNAIYALGHIGDPKVVPKLENILKTWDVYHQVESIVALWRIDPASIDPVPLILERMETDEVEILRQCCWALGEIGPEAKDVLPKLREMAGNSTDPYLRELASDAISKIEGTWVEELDPYEPCCIDFWL